MLNTQFSDNIFFILGFIKSGVAALSSNTTLSKKMHETYNGKFEENLFQTQFVAFILVLFCAFP